MERQDGMLSRLADVLDSNQDEIVDIWADQAHRSASGTGLSRPELIDSIPAIISRIAGHLRDGESEDESSHKVTQLHLGARLRQGFCLDEAVREYTLLGESVSRIWPRMPPEARPCALEIERFYQLLNAAIGEVVQTFNEHLAQDEQAEKRYLRALDSSCRLGRRSTWAERKTNRPRVGCSASTSSSNHVLSRIRSMAFAVLARSRCFQLGRRAMHSSSVTLASLPSLRRIARYAMKANSLAVMRRSGGIRLRDAASILIILP
jgi:hypothetical protein